MRSLRPLRPSSFLTSLLLVPLLIAACGDDDATSTPGAGAGGNTAAGGNASGGAAGKASGGANAGGAGTGGTNASGAGGSGTSGTGGSAGTSAAGGGGSSGTGGTGAGAGSGGASGTGGSASGAGGTAAGGSGAAGKGGSGAAGKGGTAAGSAGTGGGPTTKDAPVVSRTYKPLAGNVLNPERGFHRYVDLLDGDDLSDIRKGGSTLVYSYVHLDAFRTKAIPASFLADITKNMATLRKAGLKIVLRFAYNEGPYPNPEPDASKDQVLAHLDQLKPILEANVDVIAVLQAGFIGAWGEWHTSTNKLDTTPTAWKAILQKILDVLPPSRMTQVRTPVRKQDMFGGQLDPAKAFTSEPSARVGHMNDCFLASDDDEGTYEGDVAKWKGFVAAESKYVVQGGETCNDNPPRSSCTTAKKELAELHFSYLNRDYEPGVIASWQQDKCFDEIASKLGYRLALTGAKTPDKVRPGGSFPLTIELENTGYAAPFNPRPVYLVLSGPGGPREIALAGIDPRRWLPGKTTLTAHVTLPAGLAPGAYELALFLPDDSALRTNSAYSIHLANDGIWSDATGHNTLASITVAADAEGTGDPAAIFAATGATQVVP